ncbi:TetR/AcrR family transcriptional regulator [Kribbella sandramycini]|uniref:AcrR family transcriptional regulator n=1 Tax=Kribbella sandramycini TaxID=60450 RepID=A0A7Y4P0D8_9ACTN|nr:TetR/AcrR family transcriptional regulator [Kribbella sandramycini]MBB6569205.1 AcrR family transcriptional regulator [Kribbella sandramycini]NOL40954.1 TetR/AcrR family transcriptional regulator [Kribbella sandramycini]
MARVGLTPERLTRAGAELADEIGFDQVSVSALARRFGVQVASLYSHVKSSHDLHSRIAVLALGEMADRGAEAVAGRAGRDALIALAGVYRDYAREHPGRYAAAQYRVEPGSAAVEVGRRHSELSRAVLRGYELGEPAQTDAIRLLGSVFHGYVSLELGGSFDHSSPSGSDSWPRVLDALDVLLRNWPERQPQ